MYKSGEEYNIRYYNSKGEEQTCTLTPEEDMNRPQVIKKLKEDHKDFLKLIECKLMEGDSKMEYKTYKDLVEDERAADVCDDVYDMCVYIDYEPGSEDYFDQCLEKICSELEIKDADIDHSIVTCNVTDWVRNHIDKLDEIFAIDAPDKDAKVEEFVCEMFSSLVSGNATDKAYEQLYYALIDAPIPYTEQPEAKPEDVVDHTVKVEEAKKDIGELVPTLKQKAYEILQSEDYGFPEDDAKDYTIIELKNDEDGDIIVEVRAELSYDGMLGLIDYLDPVIAGYDKEAYFDMVEPGIAQALITGYTLPVVEEAKVEDPMEEVVETLVEEIVEEAKEKQLIKKYQLALSSYDGISPQKYEIFDSKEEADEVADSYNKSNGLGKYGNPNAEWVVIEREVYEESEIALSESYFNLYNAMNDLYSIDKYSPKELIDFLNGLKDQERISDKDYDLLIDYANEHQALIDKCGYESKVLDEAVEEVKAISKERKAEIIAELFDWIDYHDLDAYEFLNVTEEDLDKCSHLELDEERMDDILSKGIVCVDEHVHDMVDKIIAFKDVIGLNNEEIEILEVDVDLSEEEPIEESKIEEAQTVDLSMEIKPWYKEEHKEDGDFWKDIKDGVTFQDVQDALDKGENVYDTFGVGDSVVRENIFQKLSELRNVDYDVVYNEWLHSGEQVNEEEIEALKKVFNSIIGTKKEESKLVEDETSEEDLEEFAEEVEEAIEEVGPTDESEELAVKVINDSVDVLEVDETMAVNGYIEFLNAAKEILAPAMYEVLEKEINEIIADEEDHLTKLENIKATFHLENIELPVIVPEQEEPVEAEEEVIEESKSLVTLNDVLDELEADIDSPMAQEEGPVIEEFIKDHPELTAIQIAKAYRNYEETGSFEYIEDSEEE